MSPIRCFPSSVVAAGQTGVAVMAEAADETQKGVGCVSHQGLRIAGAGEESSQRSKGKRQRSKPQRGAEGRGRMKAGREAAESSQRSEAKRQICGRAKVGTTGSCAPGFVGAGAGARARAAQPPSQRSKCKRQNAKWRTRPLGARNEEKRPSHFVQGGSAPVWSERSAVGSEGQRVEWIVRKRGQVQN